MIGRNAVIESGSFIENTVVGEGSTIAGGARVLESVLWENTSIGRATQISDAIIGSDTKIGEDCTVMEHSVISDRVDIEDHAMIAAGVKIWPDKVVGRRAHVTESFIWGDRISGELFTNGRVTGKVNTDISPEFASRLGAALGAKTGKGGRIAISRDVDRASQMIERAFFCGVLASGVDVEDLGVIPIPVMRQYLSQRNLGAGVHIRRSPRTKNAVDIIVVNGDGTDISNAYARKVEQIFYRGDFPRAEYDEIGILERPMNVWEAYSNRVQKYIDMDLLKSKKLRVVVDYRFGGAVSILQPLLTKAGIRVYPVNAVVDTTRITRTRQELNESLMELAGVVKTLKADIGFMIDPSGERLSIVDNQGNYYDSHDETYLITRLFLETHKAETIAFPIGATMAVSMLAREHGAKEIRTKGTHLAMMEAARTKGIDLVGGTKGGFIFPEFGFSADAMFALLMTLEMLVKLDKNIVDFREDIPSYIRKFEEVECPWHKKGTVMRSLIDQTREMPRDVVDGVRIITSDSWCLMVPSPEEPFFSLVVEAHTEEQADQMIERYRNLLQKWQGED